MRKTPIQLSRHFNVVTGGTEYLKLESSWLFSPPELRKEVGWDEILGKKCAVVLGEAGSGKTTEFQMIAKEQQEGGGNTFFLRITDLADNPNLENALDAVDVSRYRQWLSSDASNEASFFLDSVDEARLRDLSYFGRAVRNFANALGPHLNRAKVFLSCRVSDWRPYNDQEQLERNFLSVDVFQIVPLDEPRIRLLAEYHGVVDTDAFIRALEDASALELASRPQDVEWLANYWNSHGQLGRLTEIIENSIQERLKENRERPSNVSIEDANLDIQRLALVAVLSSKSSFSLDPSVHPDGSAADDLDPFAILADRNRQHVDEVLSRGVFDEATLGRVRFHHRTVREYLAAKEFHCLRRNGLAFRELERLFFRPIDNTVTVPTHLLGTLGWLTMWDSDLREMAIIFAPEFLIDGGDPSVLPDADRAAVLRNYSKKYLDRRWTDNFFAKQSLRRFASPSLASTLNDLLEEDGSPETHRTLLRIIREGKIVSCADTVLRLAENSDRSPDVRGVAVEALGVIGTAEQKQRLLNLLNDPSIKDHNLAGPFAASLFPEVLEITQLVELLKRVESGTWRRVTSLDGALYSELPEKCSQSVRLEFLEHIRELIEGSADPISKRSDRFHSPFKWLVSSYSQWVYHALKQWDQIGPLPPELDRSLSFLAFFIKQEMGRSMTHVDSVTNLVSKMPVLRQHLFWKRIDEFRMSERRNPRHPFELFKHDDLFTISENDRNWLIVDAQTRSLPADKALAFYILLWTTKNLKQEVDFRDKLTNLSKSNPILGRIWERLHRPSHFDPLARKSAKFDREHKLCEKRKKERISEAKHFVSTHLTDIEAGTDFDALFKLYELSQRGYQYGKIETNNIVEEYGVDVENAFRCGLKHYWRTTNPVLRHLSEERNSTPYFVMLALAGITVTFDDGVDTSLFSAEELEKAIIIGAWEINGFPPWFEKLTANHTERVRDVLKPSIQHDFFSSDEENENLSILEKVSYAPEVIREAFRPVVTRYLFEDEPGGFAALQQSLEIVWSTLDRDSGIVANVEQRCQANLARLNFLALWWITWLRVSPANAIDFLENSVEGMPVEQAKELMVELCHCMEQVADDRPDMRLSIELDLNTIRRLYPLVVRFVRVEEDIDHSEEGAHGVTPRDRAERFRGRLYKWLEQCREPETYHVIQDLIANPEMVALKDALHNVAARWARNSDPCLPISENDAITFCKEKAQIPRTANDLFFKALDRIEDVKTDVETGRFSLRGLFTELTHETEFQKFLASQLDQRSRGHYSVVREEEFDRKKKPDISLQIPEGQIAIEVKVANRWSFTELQNGLSQQLVGEYLHNATVDHGIYLLCLIKGERHWDAPDGTKSDFPQILKCLQAIADEIRSTDVKIRALQIVGIDFSERP